MKFKPATCYTEKLHFKLDCLPQPIVEDLLRDGRNVSAFIYQWLLHRFSNLTSERMSGEPLRLTDGKYTYQLRTVGSSCYTNPHKQNGIKRKYDKKEHAESLREIDYLILADIEEMPTISLAAIDAAFFFDKKGKPRSMTPAEVARQMVQDANLYGKDEQ
jgi:hypothetical protein